MKFNHSAPLVVALPLRMRDINNPSFLLTAWNMVIPSCNSYLSVERLLRSSMESVELLNVFGGHLYSSKYMEADDAEEPPVKAISVLRNSILFVVLQVPIMCICAETLFFSISRLSVSTVQNSWDSIASFSVLNFEEHAYVNALSAFQGY
ncbi:hypothetical protein TNCV_2424851 [Trichonephila clavipes]|nr:hypothetical protein TNCV_2424851 [Trichonephila clavipes]